MIEEKNPKGPRGPDIETTPLTRMH